MAELVSKISSAVRVLAENSECAKLLKYEGGQYFDVHVDALLEIPTYDDEIVKSAQRLFTGLCYLKDVDGEGQTAFPNLKIAVKPKLGRVLVFSNIIPGKDEPHPDSTHAGFSASSEVRCVLSVWWRKRNFHIPRTFPSTEIEYALF